MRHLQHSPTRGRTPLPVRQVSGLAVSGLSGFCPGSLSPTPPAALGIPLAHTEPCRARLAAPWVKWQVGALQTEISRLRCLKESGSRMRKQLWKGEGAGVQGGVLAPGLPTGEHGQILPRGGDPELPSRSSQKQRLGGWRWGR